MKVVSIINYKGGVGKTTLTANLAAEMAYRGKKVLVIDLDPQTNLTFCFVRVDEWENNYKDNKTIKFWFDSIIRNKANKPSFEDLIITRQRIDIICSHLGLIDVDLDLSANLSGGTFERQRWAYINTYSYVKNELYHLKDKYDVVLFDCPPNFSTVTKNALVASDYYVIPAKLDHLSTLGINHLRNHVDNLTKEYNNYIMQDEECSQSDCVNPEFLGVIATMVQIRDGDLINSLRAQKNELIRNHINVFNNMVRENKTVFPQASQGGTPVVLQKYSYSYGSTYYNIAEELECLTTEFMKRVGI